VSEINARLDQRFRLLTTGNRTARPRDQTLRALIDWSYELLSSEEQVVFGRLSVFAGGWTLDAAEAVAPAATRRNGRRSTCWPRWSERAWSKPR
jgi:predicted ATPase